MIEAVVFDMDGVLIDAKEWHYEALNRALQMFGYEISRHAHLTTYDGLPTSRKLAMLSLESDLPRELHSFINEMKQVYTMEITHSRCRPQFIHEYALSSLKAANYKLAVASNSIRQTVEVMMQKSSLSRYLNLVVAANEVSHPKPHPEIYLTAMAKLAVSPTNCLVVEDNENGIRAAKASGAHVLVVRDVQEVNFDNIMSRITKINEGSI